jgi:hypothetical protein
MFGPTAPISAAELAQRTSSIPEHLSSISQAVTELGSTGALQDRSGAILIGPWSRDGISSFDVMLYPGISVDDLLSYERIHQFSVAPGLAELLLSLNGCTFFELVVYGLPPSMAREPPLLDRSDRGPLDIASGRDWSRAYLATPADSTLFASKNVSETGQIGFFLTPDGGVIASGNGEELAPAHGGSWPTLTEWAEVHFAVS